MREQLQKLASGGWLPPWHQWFPQTAIESAVPDAELRARFIEELRGVPLSPICEHEANEAEPLGWLVVRESLGHLGMLAYPERVSALLGELASC